MKSIFAALALVVLLGACAQYNAVKQSMGSAVTAVKQGRYMLAEKAEELRCKRSIELVLKMADKRGDAWFVSYLRSCPSVESYLRRIAAILQPRPMLPSEDGKPIPVIVVAPVEVVK